MTMILSINNPEVDRILEELIQITGETRVEAIRVALLERKLRFMRDVNLPFEEEKMMELLTRDIWSKIPSEILGTTITKAEKEEILGYGNDGC